VAVATADRFSQGRIRVNRFGAEEAREALDAHLGFLLDARGAVIDVPEARSKLNARIEHTRRVLDELDRTSRERGWTTDGQHIAART
jgi:hypothetical protein